MLFRRLLEWRARHQPDDTALASGSRALTYGELVSLPGAKGSTIVVDDRWKAACAFIGNLMAARCSLPINPELAAPPTFSFENDDAVIILTSGSSGTPRGVRLSERNLIYSALAAARNMPLRRGDQWLLSLPLYHISGVMILVRCLVAGATVVFDEAAGKRGVTHVSMVPTQLQKLLSEGRRYPQLKAILLGGAGSPRALIEEAHQAGLPLFRTYGMSETCSQFTTTQPKAQLAELLSSGRPLRGHELRIQDGEIEVRGRSLFHGYAGEPPRPAGAWFATGDLGYLDQHGRLFVTGRKDNMFISGGENIHPEEIESVLLEHPAISQAVVVPVDDRKWGQRPLAVVDGDLTEPQILDYLRKHLPVAKVPDRVAPWPANFRGLKPSRKRILSLTQAE